MPVNGKAVGGIVLADHLRSVDYRERSMSFVEPAALDTLEGVVSLVLELVDPQQA